MSTQHFITIFPQNNKSEQNKLISKKNTLFDVKLISVLHSQLKLWFSLHFQ